MVTNNSKKIKKTNKFGELVEQKTKKSTKIVQNRNALINEYKSRNKKSGMKDQRFLADRGVNAKFLGTLDKKQRKKLAFFNIDDDDAKNLVMTHKGINIDELDDFKDNEIERSISDDNIDADMVHNMHFGGFDEEDGEKTDARFQQRRKTKQEIYAELIHKSKKMKFQRQQQQEEAMDKVQELDDDFDEIAQLLMKNPMQYKEDKKTRVKDDPYLAIQTQLAYDKRIKAEANNTQDPKEAKKNGKKRKGDEDKEEKDSDSELGIEEDTNNKKKKADRKLKGELKDERATKKFFSFVDEIKNLKNAHKTEDDDSLADLEVESDEEDDEEGEEGDDDDDEGDEFDDDDDDEEDF